MPDVKSVIFILENWGKTCPWSNCAFCGDSNKCENPTIHEAVELLKKQIPSVIDYNDLHNYEVVWLEDVDKEEIVPGIIGEISDNSLNPYVWFCIDSVNDVFGMKDEYNKRWRAWSGRPSDNVRYMEPWIG